MTRKYGMVAIAFILSALFCMQNLAAFAQGPPPQEPPPDRVKPIPAGGQWQEFDSKDPMTDVPRAHFQLVGDNPLRASESNPKINIYCENGNYLFAHFVPNVRLGPDRPGFWGQPQVEVRVRADHHLDNHGWNWNGRYLSMDKGSVRELLGANVFKIQLPGPGNPDNIASFSPTGLTLGAVQQACHLAPKR